ncbi:hypothetical protein CYJ93_02905 [Micrococcus luteus]|nr:hypothetical protein CYJ93_02905 [Micrococcus luteus]
MVVRSGSVTRPPCGGPPDAEAQSASLRAAADALGWRKPTNDEDVGPGRRFARPGGGSARPARPRERRVYLGACTPTTPPHRI